MENAVYKERGERGLGHCVDNVRDQSHPLSITTSYVHCNLPFPVTVHVNSLRAVRNMVKYIT